MRPYIWSYFQFQLLTPGEAPEAEAAAAEAAPEAAPAEAAEAVPEVEAEKEPEEMTLDEWKALQVCISENPQYRVFWE